MPFSRPDWLDGAKFVGTKLVDQIMCNCWNQTWDADPTHDLTYCAEVGTDRAIHWRFGIDGAEQDVVLYEPGGTAPDPSWWEVPAYCNTTTTATQTRGNETHAAAVASNSSVRVTHHAITHHALAERVRPAVTLARSFSWPLAWRQQV